jgi:hypothetical protein
MDSRLTLTGSIRKPYRVRIGFIKGTSFSTNCTTRTLPSGWREASKAVRGGNNSAEQIRPFLSATNFIMGLSHKSAPFQEQSQGPSTMAKLRSPTARRSWTIVIQARRSRLVHQIGLTYVDTVKTLTVGEAQGQLAELIAEAHKGAVIILTDGEKQVWLDTQEPLDLETDNPELEAELLKAIEGPFTPYSPQEMRSIGERIIKEKRDK